MFRRVVFGKQSVGHAAQEMKLAMYQWDQPSLYHLTITLTVLLVVLTECIRQFVLALAGGVSHVALTVVRQNPLSSRKVSRTVLIFYEESS